MNDVEKIYKTSSTECCNIRMMSVNPYLSIALIDTHLTIHRKVDGTYGCALKHIIFKLASKIPKGSTYQKRESYIPIMGYNYLYFCQTYRPSFLCLS